MAKRPRTVGTRALNSEPRPPPNMQSETEARPSLYLRLVSGGDEMCHPTSDRDGSQGLGSPSDPISRGGIEDDEEFPSDGDEGEVRWFACAP